MFKLYIGGSCKKVKNLLEKLKQFDMRANYDKTNIGGTKIKFIGYSLKKVVNLLKFKLSKIDKTSEYLNAIALVENAMLYPQN
uniref:Reverse transcriptase Ty1/copia-type domain-containing protein n=1 Tax=Strongyloides stercoralis TaxID=6248 RepID=A0A0K0DRZ5_STRER